MNTLQQAFLSYATKVIPTDVGPVQMAETRQAFYAGSLSTFNLMLTFAEFDEETAAKMLDTLSQEVTTFFDK